LEKKKQAPSGQHEDRAKTTAFRGRPGDFLKKTIPQKGEPKEGNKEGGMGTKLPRESETKSGGTG